MIEAQPGARLPGSRRLAARARAQRVGLAVSDDAKEAAVTQAAGRNGVDRIVKLGRMHVFGSPWDGADLVRPMVRLVRHVRANTDGSRY